MHSVRLLHLSETPNQTRRSSPASQWPAAGELVDGPADQQLPSSGSDSDDKPHNGGGRGGRAATNGGRGRGGRGAGMGSLDSFTPRPNRQGQAAARSRSTSPVDARCVASRVHAA